MSIVYFENTGADADGNSLLTDYADVVSGKIAFVFRGTSSFYQKHMAVAAAGAAGAVVCNNQAGVIRMDLSDSTATIPCISILQTEAADIKAASTPVYAEDGTTVLVLHRQADRLWQDGHERRFLRFLHHERLQLLGCSRAPCSMKPEITAPGGNIYSVNGAVAGGQAYEDHEPARPWRLRRSPVWRPCVAQYIRENGLEGKDRRLRASSGPEPADVHGRARRMMPAPNPGIPSCRQGAGLANVSNAIHAESYRHDGG